MKRKLAAVALVVRDYDEAIAYYTQVLGFELVEDRMTSAEKRWVLIKPPGSSESGLLLAKASNDQRSVVAAHADVEIEERGHEVRAVIQHAQEGGVAAHRLPVLGERTDLAGQRLERRQFNSRSSISFLHALPPRFAVSTGSMRSARAAGNSVSQDYRRVQRSELTEPLGARPWRMSATWATVSIDWCSIAGSVSPAACGVAITS